MNSDLPDSKKITVTDNSSGPEVVQKTAPLLGESEQLEPTIETAAEASQPVAIKDTRLDKATEQAIDEISAAETAETTDTAEQPGEKPAPKKSKGRWRRFFGSHWTHRLAILLVLGLIAAFVAVPKVRYTALNIGGVRVNASVTVIDDSTQQPLRNVQVMLADQTATTDELGRAHFQHMRLGKTQLTVRKRAFADKTQTVTLGWGSNPLSPQALNPIGTQYDFSFMDYLSGKAVIKAEAATGEASALSDERGEAKLTIDLGDDESTVKVTVKAAGYRTETIDLDPTSEAPVKVTLVPDKKHVFISKRSGKYDVYQIDVDGTNEEKILSGSGVEKDDLVLVQHPSKEYAALVSTRENVRDSDGFLLSTLTLINTKLKTPTKIAQSQRVQLIDWVGDRLIFVQIAPNAASTDPARHRLVSYDLVSGSSKELARANYFNDVIVVNGSVYFAPSATYSANPVAFYKVNPDGSGQQTAFDQEVWNVYRSDFDRLTLTIGGSWYDYQISANKASQLGGEPSNLASRVYTDNPARTKSAWVDQRDGKGVIVIYDTASKTEKVLYQAAGVSNPVEWINDNALIFRVNTGTETADYAINLDATEPKKIQNVTNTAGIDRWYYY